MLQPSPPSSEQQLIARCQHIAGQALGDLANAAGVEVPKDFKREKGWSGQLLEWHLGATAGSKPTQDFPELGIELKTIPLDLQARPLESTYVCITPLLDLAGHRWENSNVRNKLSRVLWVPLIADRGTPPAERMVGQAFIWSPSPQQEQLLRTDWEELTEMIALGQVEQITAHHGEVMQLRPKAANAKARTKAIGPKGLEIETLPRGYYLRTEFTRQIISEHFELYDL